MFNLILPNLEGATTQFQFDSDKITFLIGPNGSGKSTLFSLLTRTNLNQVTRISASRMIALDSSAPKLNGSQRNQYETYLKSDYNNQASRYFSSQASNIRDTILFDLKEAGNVYDRSLIETLQRSEVGSEGEVDAIRSMRLQSSPLFRVQKTLAAGGLYFDLSFDQTGALIATNQRDNQIPIEQLSDGERAAFLLASRVITAPANQLVLIDEPERHLHRSISSPLIHALLEERRDCTFLVSTHDLMLVSDHPHSSAIIVRDFIHPNRWDSVFLENIGELPEDVTQAILGARKKVLYIEGNTGSLDNSLYSILVPNIAVEAVGSCSKVIENTRGVNASRDLHHVKALGIVDRDKIPQERVQALIQQSVFPLELHSIESIYFHPNTIRTVVDHLIESGIVDEAVSSERINQIISQSFQRVREPMIADSKARICREYLINLTPKQRDFMDDQNLVPQMNTVDLAQKLSDVENDFNNLIAQNNGTELVAKYNVKRTDLSNVVLTLCNLQGTATYESLVRKLAKSNEDFANSLRAHLGDLIPALTT